MRFSEDTDIVYAAKRGLVWIIYGVSGAAAGAAAIFAFIGMMAVLFHFPSKRTCLTTGEVMGVQTAYSFDTGCMMRTSAGVWLESKYVVAVERDNRIVFVPKAEK